jgi:hypothetical protein
MPQEPTKERFFDLLHRASQSQQKASLRKGVEKKSGASSGKRTRQRSPASASL